MFIDFHIWLMTKWNQSSFFYRIPFGTGLLLFPLFLFPSSTLHSQPSISFDLDCSQGPGQAQLEVESPLGANWTYALDGRAFQTSATFLNIFPGNHWLIVRNTSGELDSTRFNANCGLEPFSCSDCDKSEGFYQVFGTQGELARLDFDEGDFQILPNSPANYGLNAVGINPNDSLAYGIKRIIPCELIVIDRTGRTVNLGVIDMLPGRVYQAGDFDPDGFLHVKDNERNRQVFMIDVKQGRVERTYNLSSPLYTADFAYNPVDKLFYGLNRSGMFYSFDALSGVRNFISNTPMPNSFGAVYSDKSGRIWGIQNSTGNLYEVDVQTGQLSLVMTTASSSRNDGFSCQNSFFSRTGPPVLEVECSSLSNRVNLRIIQPEGVSYEYKLNDGDFESDTYFENLLPGEYEVIARSSGCLPDTTSITLAPQHATSAEIRDSSCSSFTSPSGMVWLNSGTYQDTLVNSMGCDSIINYEITILETTSSSRSIVTCDTYTWNGMTLDSSGVYDFLTTNEAGCDSVAQLNLTIQPFLDTAISLTTCRPYSSPDGEELWTETGMYRDTILSSLGCDSIITVNLEIGDVSAEWDILDPACPDHFVSRLEIDTISHQGPHFLVRNPLDTLLISNLPTEISDFPPGEHSIQFISADSCVSPVYSFSIEEIELPEIRLVGPTEINICDPPTLYRLETNMPGNFQ